MVLVIYNLIYQLVILDLKDNFKHKQNYVFSNLKKKLYF